MIPAYLEIEASSAPSSVLINLTSEITPNEWLSAVTSAFVVIPLASTDLTVVRCYPSGSSSVTLEVSGGHPGITYGVDISLVVNSSVVGAPPRTVVLPFSVRLSSTVSSVAEDFPSVDPNSFATLVDEIIAGESAMGKANFMLPAGAEVDGGSVQWALLDKQGSVYAQGSATDYIITNTAFSTLVEAHAVITAPSSLPPSSEGHKYQLRWALVLPGSAIPTYNFESISVSGLTSAPIGTETAIEMYDDHISLATVCQRRFDAVKVEVYDSMNRKIIADNVITVNSPKQVAGGYYYAAEIDPNNVSVTGGNPFPAQLDGYVVNWKFITNGSSLVSRQTAELFVVNPSILAAMDDSRRMVMKAKTTQFGFPDAMFDDPTILSWLRRGRDLFNSAAGVLVEFSMTNATGGIREYWLRYAEVSMLRAQALAEGEKAFNFAGSAIQLDVDKTQYYTGLADTLQQQLDADVKPFKQNLIKKSMVAGDGNMTGTAMSSTGASRLGIGIHAASQFNRYAYWRR